MAKERGAAKEDGETDSVFLAAWTSARIPSASFSDDSFLGDEVRVGAVCFSVAVQETKGSDKIKNRLSEVELGAAGIG